MREYFFSFARNYCFVFPVLLFGSALFDGFFIEPSPGGPIEPGLIFALAFWASCGLISLLDTIFNWSGEA